MYVLNGKIDECQHSSVAISRASRVDSTGVPIRKGDVCSNRLGKLTKSRQLSACSWVTDFECSHVTYACIVRAFIACIHAENSPPKPGVATPLANSGAMPLQRAFKRAHIAHPPFPRLATVLLNPFYFTRTQPVSCFARFHFRDRQPRVVPRVYCSALHPRFLIARCLFLPFYSSSLFHKSKYFHLKTQE